MRVVIAAIETVDSLNGHTFFILFGVPDDAEVVTINQLILNILHAVNLNSSHAVNLFYLFAVLSFLALNLFIPKLIGARLHI